MTPMAAKSGPNWKTRAAIGAALVVCLISYPAQVGHVLLALGHGAVRLQTLVLKERHA